MMDLQEIEATIHFEKPTLFGGSDYVTFICQEVKYSERFILISFFELDLKINEGLQRVVGDRVQFTFGDSEQKYIKIPIQEIYSLTVRTNRR